MLIFASWPLTNGYSQNASLQECLAKANSFQFLAVHQGFSLAFIHSVFYVYRVFPPSVHPAAPRSFFQPLQAVPLWCCSNQACVLLQHSSLCFVHVYLLWSLTRLWAPPGFSGSGWMTEWINRFQHCALFAFWSLNHGHVGVWMIVHNYLCEEKIHTAASCSLLLWTRSWLHWECPQFHLLCTSLMRLALRLCSF